MKLIKLNLLLLNNEYLPIIKNNILLKIIKACIFLLKS